MRGLRDLASEDIMSLLLLNQYFDTLKDVRDSQHELVPCSLQHSGGLDVVARQMSQGIIKKSV